MASPTDRQTSLFTRLAYRTLRGVDRLRGRAPASRGDFVVFTDAALAADTGCRGAVVHRVAAPRETRSDLEWALQVEPVAQPDANRYLDAPAPASTRRFWVRGEKLSTDPDDAVAGRDIAAATQADYVGLIPASMLDAYVEVALADIGFVADVTFDDKTNSFDATIAALESALDTPEGTIPPVKLPDRRADTDPAAVGSTSGTPSPSDGDDLPNHSGATDEAVASAIDAGSSPSSTAVDPQAASSSSSSGTPADSDQSHESIEGDSLEISLTAVDPDDLDRGTETTLPSNKPPVS